MASFSPQALPEGINAPNGANFRKQYLPTSVFLNRQDTLFFLRTLAKNMTEDEIIKAREQLGIGDDTSMAGKYVTVPVVEQQAYNGFFIEMDIQRPSTITTTADADGDALATETVVANVPHGNARSKSGRASQRVQLHLSLVRSIGLRRRAFGL